LFHISCIGRPVAKYAIACQLDWRPIDVLPSEYYSKVESMKYVI
jgi:hypothetical protein